MKYPTQSLKILTIATFLYTPGVSLAQPAQRCEADLGRVNTSFCLSNLHQDALSDKALQYDWQLDDDSYALSSEVCLNSNSTSGGERQDLFVAVDRSQNIWGADSGSKKLGADNISTTLRMIDKLVAEQNTSTKFGLMMFSVENNCTEYTGGSIYADKTFPCLYIPAANLQETGHVTLLKEFLNSARGLYSEGGLASSSQYNIVSDLMTSGAAKLDAARPAGLILMSDGRTYSGQTGDTYAYLKSQNYYAAQAAAIDSFSTSGMSRFTMIFSLNPLQTPVFDNTHIDAMDNMCALPLASQADCAVEINRPSTWLVNKMDINGFANKLVARLGGGPSNVITLNDATDIDGALETIKYGNAISKIDSVQYSIDGGKMIAGTVDGNRIRLGNLPADQEFSLEIAVKSLGKEVKFPLQLSTQMVSRETPEFSDKEMQCSGGIKTATEEPKNKLKNLQGGSASCGVVGFKESSSMTLLVILSPLMFLLVRRKKATVVVTGIAAMVFVSLANPASAKDSTGLNALQYKPVNNGVGTTETARPVGSHNLDAGIYMDYSNDAVEIGGDKNKRIDSIMDDLVTAHAVLNYGFTKEFSLGVHLPYVQKTDLNRSIDSTDKTGGNIGQPSDSTVSAKYMFEDERSLAMAIMPMITVPTGAPALLIGDGTTLFGAALLFSGQSGRLTWAYNLGYMHRQNPVVLGDDRTNDIIVRGQILNMGGAEFKLPLPGLSLSTNLQTKLSTGDRIDLNRNSPAEWNLSGKLKLATEYVLQTGFGTGLGKGYGSPDYRVWAGFSWEPKTDVSRKLAKRK